MLMPEIKKITKSAKYKSLDSDLELIGTVEKAGVFLEVKLERENILKNSPYLLLTTSAVIFAASIFTNWFLILINGFVIIYIIGNLVVITNEESLRVVKGLAYEINSKTSVREKTVYIPYEKVQHVFINEVINRQKVINLLTIMYKDDSNNEKLITLFKYLLPKQDFLQLAYKEIKALIDPEFTTEN